MCSLRLSLSGTRSATTKLPPNAPSAVNEQQRSYRELRATQGTSPSPQGAAGDDEAM
jgi:hypothetical protein